MSDGGELLLPVFILHKSTVKATFNTPCELLAGLSGEEVGGVNPLGPTGCRKLPGKRTS